MTPTNLPDSIGKRPQGLNPTQGTTGKAGSGKVVPPRDEHTNWLFSVKRSALKTYIQVTSYGLNKFYLGICMYKHTYMHVIKISGRRGRDLKEWGGICGRVGGQKEKG